MSLKLDTSYLNKDSLRLIKHYNRARTLMGSGRFASYKDYGVSIWRIGYGSMEMVGKVVTHRTRATEEDIEEQLKIDFEKNLKNLSYSDQEKNFKENNFKEFLKQGFPNRKLENWKFSDLNQIIKSNIGDLNFYNDYSK